MTPLTMRCPGGDHDAIWTAEPDARNDNTIYRVDCAHCDQPMTLRAQLQRALDRRAA